LYKLDLVKGLPITKFVKDKICDACQLGKQTKSSFKKKKIISTSRPLELLHMDLFGLIRTASLNGKLYAFVIVDDYSRYKWVLFLAHKNKAHKTFVKHCRRIQNEKGYNQEEGIDYGETYAPVARLEAIRMLLAFACFKNFKLFQMDVKSVFLNGFIAEEVYVEQPPGFENHEFPNHVFKLSKALYGLKQAPRAWYERLSGFLIEREKLTQHYF
jgi:hypothetical protein